MRSRSAAADEAAVDALLRIVCAAVVVAGLGASLHGLTRGQAPAAEAAWWESRLEPPTPPTADERALGRVASAIARRDVSVRCVGEDLPDPGPNAAVHGVVWFYDDRPANYAVIAPNLCRELLAVRATGLTERESRCLGEWAGLGCADTVAAKAFAMTVLAHESFHLAGVRDEPAADCYAIQTVAFVARQLGVGARQAEGIAAFARVNHRVGQGRRYRSSECREGGALDLHPGIDNGLG